MKNTEKYNYFIGRLWNVSLIYFTVWALIIQAFYYIGVLKRYQESVLFIAITVAFIGAVLVYIYPRRIVLKNIEVEFKGHQYQIFDLLCHQLPLILLLLYYDPKIKPDNLLFGVVSLLIYIIIYNPLKVYNFDKVEDNSNKKGGLTMFDKKVRYNVASAMIFCYIILAILAIKFNVFK